MVSLAEAREYAYWDANDDLSQRVLDGIHAEVNRRLPHTPSDDLIVLKLWALYVAQWEEDEPVNLLEERDKLFRSFGWAPTLDSVQHTSLLDSIGALEKRLEVLEKRPTVDPTLESRVAELEAAGTGIWKHHTTYSVLYNRDLGNGIRFVELPEGSLSPNWVWMLVDIVIPIPGDAFSRGLFGDTTGSSKGVINNLDFVRFLPPLHFVTSNQSVSNTNSFSLGKLTYTPFDGVFRMGRLSATRGAVGVSEQFSYSGLWRVRIYKVEPE